MNPPSVSIAPEVVDTSRLRALDRCDKNRSYTIRSIEAQPHFGAQDAQVGLRLAELGFLPGCRLKVIGHGLLGRDPLAVQINGTKFALRRAEATKILVEPTECEA